MTVKDVFTMYLQGFHGDRRVVFCDQKHGDGFEIKSEEQFQSILSDYEPHDLFISNKIETNDLIYFEYFTMELATPSVAIVRHPHLANAYFKEAPDRIIDLMVNANEIYHFISVDYGNSLKDIVIEFPTVINQQNWAFLKSKFPGAFFENNNESDYSYSMVFTNTDRFDDIEQLAFKNYTLESVYPDLKRVTIKVVANRIWKELKIINK